MSFLTKHLFQLPAKRALTTMSSFSPLKMGVIRSPFIQAASTSMVENSVPTFSYLNALFGLTQRRWKSRGNTYQPSTLKRKRRVGFLARAKSKQGYKILKRRREKGRWYLTH
ncbi:LANO_0C06502g1_1 [Lachancea nothofagi CBS 11611]|uniref:Large ribosomal subunit protein bL34m n=1 Tax=Lachancea nothofagi CBS 11611 TaxID=1266666 RepID=A0A1G4J862_9SACH|nr:LANO_0C06502g1_1 [Lachancea nothofagi CBS 11611]